MTTRKVMSTTFERTPNSQLLATRYRISDAVLNATSVDDILKTVHLIVAELLALTTFYVVVYGEQTGMLSVLYCAGDRDCTLPSIQKQDEAANAYVLRTGRPLLCERGWTPDCKELDNAEPIGGVSSGDWLGAPLRVRESTLGLLVVENDKDRTAYSQRDLTLLECIAVQVAHAIEREWEEERLRLKATALEAAANAVVITNREGTIQWVNAAFTELTGYKSEEVLGNKTRILKSGRHPQSFYAEMWDTVQQGLTWKGEITNRRKSGELYTEEMTITPVLNERDEISHFIAIKQDVSDRRTLEQQLMQSQKMDAVGRLAGGVAHDFNNLLTVILGYSDLLLHQSEQSHPDRHKFEQIKDAGRRATELTQQLLGFSRTQMSSPSVLSMNTVVNDTHELLSRLIGEDIRVTSRLTPDLGLVTADRGQLEQVLMNLAINARDAMPNGGDLVIETANVDIDEAFVRWHTGAKPGPKA
jgi:PAS domain S-box-containing protein